MKAPLVNTSVKNTSGVPCNNLGHFPLRTYPMDEDQIIQNADKHHLITIEMCIESDCLKVKANQIQHIADEEIVLDACKIECILRK